MKKIGNGAKKVLLGMILLGSIGRVHAQQFITNATRGIVALDGDTMVVGQPDDDTVAGDSSGSLAVYVRSGSSWVLQQTIVADDAGANHRLPRSLDIDGDTIVAGGFQSSVYVFRRTGNQWSQERKFFTADGGGADNFGNTVAVSGDTVAIGAYFWDSPVHNDAGRVFIFNRTGTTWTATQQLEDPTPAPVGRVGSSLALEGDTLVTGAPEGRYLDLRTGTVLVFKRTSGVWAFSQELHASDAGLNGFFGYSLSLSDNQLAVFGASVDSGASAASSKLYMFERSGGTWSEAQKLSPSDTLDGGQFGNVLSLDGETLATGSFGYDDGRGIVRVLRRVGSQWVHQESHQEPVPRMDANFGKTLALDGHALVVGATRSTAGGVYAFTLPGLVVSPDTFSENPSVTNRLSTVSLDDLSGGWTYSLTPGLGDTDNARFVFVGHDLYVDGELDFESNPHPSIRLRATKGSEILEQAFVLNLLDERTEDGDGDGLSQADEEDIYGTSDRTFDDDGDGIPGGTEVSLGLSPSEDDSNLVDAIQANPADFGVDINGLAMRNMVLLPDTTNGTFTLQLGIQHSTDLHVYTNRIIRVEDLGVNAQGEIELQLDPADGTEIYRVEAR